MSDQTDPGIPTKHRGRILARIEIVFLLLFLLGLAGVLYLVLRVLCCGS